jgi:NAD(P)-dependent dehydrogenase (short-subunit alcohol dehydrogenase family)
VLVNAAAVLLTKTLTHEVPEQELRDTITINLVAPFRACQQCLPFMMDQRYGRIVNIGSIYAERGSSDNSSYNVSKHGLLGLTRSLAHEYASYNIAVNQIDPSAVESEMMHRIATSNVERGRAESVEAYLDSVRNAIPAGRMADPKDIAGRRDLSHRTKRLHDRRGAADRWGSDRVAGS